MTAPIAQEQSSAVKSDSNLVKHLENVLQHASGREALRKSVLPAIVAALSEISQTLRSSHTVSQVGSANAFGDDQLNVDVLSENILREALRTCPSVATVSSEEDPIERRNETEATSDSSEVYTIAFDPLDGSSIIAPNWSVGTIVGIWDGASAIGQDPRAKQIASVLGVYGPRTTAVVAIRVPGTEANCFEIALDPKSSQLCEILRSKITLDNPPFKTRYFAPANLRAAAENVRYGDLIGTFISDKYTLRYSGGLVPDVVHALVKGHGIYLSPVTSASAAKLRRLYELCPVALILECAEGEAVDPMDGSKILDRALENVDERGGIVCGTASEVDKVIGALLR